VRRQLAARRGLRSRRRRSLRRSTTSRRSGKARIINSALESVLSLAFYPTSLENSPVRGRRASGLNPPSPRWPRPFPASLTVFKTTHGWAGLGVLTVLFTLPVLARPPSCSAPIEIPNLLRAGQKGTPTSASRQGLARLPVHKKQTVASLTTREATVALKKPSRTL
jgi:hypothetical protein